MSSFKATWPIVYWTIFFCSKWIFLSTQCNQVNNNEQDVWHKRTIIFVFGSFSCHRSTSQHQVTSSSLYWNWMNMESNPQTFTITTYGCMPCNVQYIEYLPPNPYFKCALCHNCAMIADISVSKMIILIKFKPNLFDEFQTTTTTMKTQANGSQSKWLWTSFPDL